jgi:hypothetical protein
MKIEIPILAALLVLGNELMVRAAVQGVEPALVTAIVEWSMGRLKWASRLIQ